ncbi:hypothetical protein [Psychromonas antarctica]|uniref:hypothetical protein n=1 Tax=Psychromonas antarctica TaxID=67573 RepID=UPI001EE97240|nr:hypothetical protein [Psychromonas antarctica]MCG6202441.1 hypothetical protein [Psychromonas antarctica]
MHTKIEQQLDELFKLEQQLTTFLDEEKYELFQQQQDIFSDKIKTLLDRNSAETLNTVIEQLKILETNIATLQNKSKQYFKQLKEQSLLQKRNKSKIKAYK